MTIAYPHRIRLRGPWELKVCYRNDQPPQTVRVHLPCRVKDAAPAEHLDHATFLRRFGYPGNIDAEERVWLTVAGVRGDAQCRVNDQVLGQFESGVGEYDVTTLLKNRNVLQIEFADADGECGLAGETALEVRRTAYLTNMRCQAEQDGTLSVFGDIVGEFSRPMDLYVIADRRTIGEMQVTPDQANRAFTLSCTSHDQSTPSSVRVELVDGGVVWYGLDLTPVILG